MQDCAAVHISKTIFGLYVQNARPLKRKINQLQLRSIEASTVWKLIVEDKLKISACSRPELYDSKE